MKISNILAISAIMTHFGFAQEPAQQDSRTTCKESLENVKARLPDNALEARQTLAEAFIFQDQIEGIQNKNPKSEKLPLLEANCLQLSEIALLQGETQTLRNRIAENREKRIAANKEISSILEHISETLVRKNEKLTNDLKAEKNLLAQNSEDAKRKQDQLQAEMNQKEQSFLEESARKEAALKAAGEREAELQKKLSEETSALEAQKKALAEERAKAAARQQEALSRLNELQSKLIQVSTDARGIILSMSDILFEVNKANLRSDLKTSLAKVAGILSVYQQFDVSIEGNTDNTGSEEYNQKLSQQRADNVMKFLIEQGVDRGRLSSKGLGMRSPIADNATKEGRQKNRRVDLVIQDKTLQNGQDKAD